METVKRGYKQTDVGVIPEDWEIHTIEDSMSLINGRAFKPEDWKDRGLPIIRIQNLNNNGSSFNYYIGPVEDRHRIQAGDLLFAWSGTTGTSFGARIWNGPTGVLNQHIFKVVPDKKKLTVEYAFLVLLKVQEHIEKQAHGFKASFVHVKKSDLVEIQLPVPPTETEQKAIAEALTDADSLIEYLEQLLVKKRHIKQGTMQELLTAKKRLPGFDREWELKKVGNLGSTFGGLTGKQKSDFGKGSSRYITFMNIMKNVVIDCGMFERVEVSPTESQNRVLKDDLFFNGSSETPEEVGMCAVLAESVQSVYLNSFCFGFRLYEGVEVDGLYLAYFFRSSEGRNLIKSLAQGATRYNLSKTAFLKIVLPVPSLPEQMAIATILRDMDTELEALNERLIKARQLKQGMMQELLTGRTRLIHRPVAIVELPVKNEATPATTAHNWQINEAVVISVLAKNFGSDQWPLGRKRYTKLSYLLHRHVEREASGYLKKAAGPYNPSTKYKGPEGIALKNRYIRPHSRDKFSGFVAAEKISDAESYFFKWYGEKSLAWLQQFRHKSNDDLELLATVDMAIEDLAREGKSATLDAVKEVIRKHPEWEAKLERPIFSDDNITKAITACQRLLG